MNNQKFAEALVKVLGGDNFFLTDRLDQEELFQIQDGLANLIAEVANGPVGAANDLCNRLVNQLPNTFKIV